MTVDELDMDMDTLTLLDTEELEEDEVLVVVEEVEDELEDVLEDEMLWLVELDENEQLLDEYV